MEVPAIIVVIGGIGFFILAMLWRHAYEEMCTENKRLRKEVKILYRIKAPLPQDKE